MKPIRSNETPLKQESDRHYRTTSMRGQARIRYRHIEGTPPAPGCSLCRKPE